MNIGKVDDKTAVAGMNGPGADQNHFDLATILGSAYSAAAMSSMYPNLAGGPFNMFGSPSSSSVLPGVGSALPFAGLGAYGDSLLTAAGLSAPGSMDSLNTLAAALSNPLLASVFAASMPNLPIPSSAASGSSQQSASEIAASGAGSKSPGSVSSVHTPSHGSQSAKSAVPRLSSTSPASSCSSSSKHDKDKGQQSSAKSEKRRTGDNAKRTPGADKHDPAALAPGKPPASDVVSLENSLLSAESALFAASPLLFPFSLPPLFNGTVPFSSASSLFPAAALMPSTSTPVGSDPAKSNKSAHGSSDKVRRVGRPPKKAIMQGNGKDAEMESTSSTHRTKKWQYSSNNAPSTGQQYHSDSGDHHQLSTSVIVKSSQASGSSHGHGSPVRSRTPKDHGSHLDKAGWSSKLASASPSVSSRGEYGSSSPLNLLKRQASPDKNHRGGSGNADGSNVAMSDDGAIDLSVKRPRHSSNSEPLSGSGARNQASSDTRVKNALCTDPAQSFAAQLIAAGQPMLAGLSGQPGLSDLSLSLAAAAAGLFPPMFDPALFYQPSVLAAMAASSQGTSVPTSSASTSATAQEKPRRGRRRGSGRGRNSSMFISSLFAQQQSLSAGNSVSGQQEVRTGRGRGSRGRGSRGGRGSNLSRSSRMDSSVATLAELEQQRQMYLDRLLHNGQLPKGDDTNSAHAKTPSKSVDQLLSRSSAASGSPKRSVATPLTDKLLQSNSKLAHTLVADQHHLSSRGAHDLDGIFKMAAERASALVNDGVGHGVRGVDLSGLARSDNDGMNEETSSACTSETASDVEGPSGHGSMFDSASGLMDKRLGYASADGSVKKRRRTILDESIVRIPLEQGWQRETRVRSFTPRKIIGEVLYITPCDRRLRNYNEVDKFLEKSGIVDMKRENFTFSTKVNIGRFYEHQASEDGTATWVLLSDEEVANRFIVIEERKRRIIETKLRAQLREEKRHQAEEMVARLAESRMQKKLEQQELARKVAEMKLKRKAEKEQQKEMLQKARQLRVMEVRRMRERQKMARQQERFHRQMQLKMEREMRHRQLNEEKEVKRQQDVVNREQERERRRLDLLMARAVEAKKKEEEKQQKERLREERKEAKKLDKENKLMQKRLELFLAREQKKPTEDMCLTDSKPLPEFDRVPGLRLPGKAFAECLTVLEFIHNFASTLGLDAESLPSLNQLQCGLLNDDGFTREFSLLTIRLLKRAFDDPGFVNPREAMLASGQKFTDIDINETGLSELLRIFIRSRNGGQDNELTRALLRSPYQSLNATQKALILTFLCNELLCAKNINAEIEKNIDLVTNMRRDKWVIESKLRKLRILQAQLQRKAALLQQQKSVTETGSGVANEDGEEAIKPDVSEDAEMKDAAAAAATADSDKEDASHTNSMFVVHDSDAEEDKKSSLDELQTKIDKLVKQQSQLRERCFAISHKLSAMLLGQDRYHRRYWIFPKCGGIYVEGLESAVPELADVDGQSRVDNDAVDNAEVQSETVDVQSVGHTELVLAAVVDKFCNGGNGTDPNKNFDTVSVKSEDIKPEPTAEVMEIDDDLTDTKPDVLDETKPDALKSSLSSCPELNAEFKLSEIKTDDLKTVSDDKDAVEDEAKPVTNDPTGSQVNISMCSASEQQPADLSQSCATDTVSMNESLDNVNSTSVVSHDFATPSQACLTPLSVFHSVQSSCTSLVGLETPMLDVGTPRSVLDLSSAVDTPSSFVSRTSTPSVMSSSNAAIAESFRLAMISAAGTLQLPPDFQMLPPPVVHPIPLAKQRGWWRITNPEVLKELLACLNLRGIREKNLQKSLERHMNFAIQSCSKARKNAMQLEVTDKSMQILSSVTTAPSPDNNEVWDLGVQRKMEMKVLEDVETIHEKLCSASLQAKGCKTPSRASTNSAIELVCSGVPASSLTTKQLSIIAVAKERLLNLERSVERRYLKPPLGRSNQLNLATVSSSSSSGASGTNQSSKDGTGSVADEESDDDDYSENETATREMSSWRTAVNNAASAAQISLYLAQLHRCIAWEKSIMKVLCQICSHDDNEAQLLLCDMCDRGYHTYCIKPKLANIPEGDWYCYECISKASGEVCCIVCGRHFGRMLTCDSCNRRVHMDCVDPPVTRMPKKWSCFGCQAEKNKSSRSCPSSAPATPIKEMNGDTNNVSKDADESDLKIADLFDELAGDRESKMDTSDTPTTSASPSSAASMKSVKSSTLSSKERRRERDRLRRERKAAENRRSESPACNGSNSEAVSSSNSLEVCKTLLSEMREHVDAWPFQTPVSSKQFPTYRKIIRCPIDFQTMARKLKSGQYKCREEFASDARLVFANCELFNEDNSSVGRAGHSMKTFFESRWSELTSSGRTESSTQQLMAL